MCNFNLKILKLMFVFCGGSPSNFVTKNCCGQYIHPLFHFDDKKTPIGCGGFDFPALLVSHLHKTSAAVEKRGLAEQIAALEGGEWGEVQYWPRGSWSMFPSAGRQIPLLQKCNLVLWPTAICHLICRIFSRTILPIFLPLSPFSSVASVNLVWRRTLIRPFSPFFCIAICPS